MHGFYYLSVVVYNSGETLLAPTRKPGKSLLLEYNIDCELDFIDIYIKFIYLFNNQIKNYWK